MGGEEKKMTEVYRCLLCKGNLEENSAGMRDHLKKKHGVEVELDDISPFYRIYILSEKDAHAKENLVKASRKGFGFLMQAFEAFWEWLTTKPKR